MVQNREIPIAVIHKLATFVLSSRHGGKRVVSLPRDKDGKSADVEGVHTACGGRFDVTHSTFIFY